MTSSVGDHLARLTLDLCRIPSETGEEAEIADLVQRRCEGAVGAENVRRIGHSVVCAEPAEPGDRRPTVALVGHLDTVRCAERQRYEIADGRVYGCGATDMKAGVAVMLALLDERAALRSARPVWIFYDREEGPAHENGLEPVLTSGALPEIDFAFVLEPTDRAVQAGCVGTINATVTVRGRRAHAARPWLGDNAIYRAIPLLERLRAREPRTVEVGGLTYRETMVATQARTVNSNNVVPDAVRINVNQRFSPASSLDEAEAELRAVVGGDGEIEVTDRAPSGEPFADHPLVRGWIAAEGLEVQPKQAWTDVARLGAHGIPAVNFGPGETAQAHQADEWCAIEGLAHCHAALLRFFAAEGG